MDAIALSTGLALVLAGAWAWLVATYVSCFGPLPAGRRGGRAVTALLGVSAAATLLLISGLGVLVAGGLAG